MPHNRNRAHNKAFIAYGSREVAIESNQIVVGVISFVGHNMF